ncbi:MAG TPA: ATP-binding cassette domain-containing protein [Gemmatimonadaceae bacterium]|nr:ATP-binding cassette domain-containing protein [Gemmatimonadaceae bacterium]
MTHPSQLESATPRMRSAAIEARGLTGPASNPGIFDITFAAPRLRTSCILGGIHSGKTLLMRHLVGLEQAAQGELVVDGEDYDPCGEPEVVVRRMRTRMGVVFQGAALISRLTVLENVELPLLEHTSATPEEAREAAHQLLVEVGMTLSEDTTPDRLDRAAQRRVALARALALRPPVLLLDEPTHDLDPGAAAELDDTLAALQSARGFAVVIFSHEVRYAFGRASQIYVMANGTIIDSGNPETLQRSEHEVVRRLLDRRGFA